LQKWTATLEVLGGPPGMSRGRYHDSKYHYVTQASDTFNIYKVKKNNNDYCAGNTD